MLDKRTWRDFWIVTFSIAMMGVGLGSTLPLTSLTLDARGFGPETVGWMLSALALGGMTGALAAPAITLRVGRRRVMLGCFLLAGASIIPLQYVTSLWSWALLRFLFGVAVAPVFVLGEAWINLLCRDVNRGRTVAIYSTSFTLSQVAGPILLNALTPFSNVAFLICGGLFLLSAPIIRLARDDTRQNSQQSAHSAHSHKDATASWTFIIRTAPSIIAGVAFFALFDSVALSFLPLLALDEGFSQSRALAAVSLVLAGDATLQFMIGWLADRHGRERIHLICGVLTCLLLPALPFVMHVPLLWIIYCYVLGGVAGAIYTLSMVASGERFSGAALLRASGLMSITWNISSSTGSAITGMIMQQFGASTMPAVLLLTAVGFVVTLRFDMKRQRKTMVPAEGLEPPTP